MKYSVVVPAHNEGKNLKKLIKSIHKELLRDTNNFEIIIVNDNSRDNSAKVLQELKKEIKQLKPINRQGKKGVGYTIRSGFSKAKGEYIITMDGDLSHDPRELPRFLKAIKKTDFVCGSRYIEQGRADMSLSRKIISGIFNFVFRGLIGLPVKDFTSGYRIFKKEIIDNIKLNSTGFGVYIEIPIKASLLGYEFSEVPISYHRRSTGKSNLSYVKQGPEYLKVAVKGLTQKCHKIFK